MHPYETTGNAGTLFFFFLIACFAYKAFKEGYAIDVKNLDMVNIGYMAEPYRSPAAATFESQQLYLDCIDALYTLGYKKSDAKKKAHLVFSTFDPQPATVQDFLMIALKP